MCFPLIIERNSLEKSKFIKWKQNLLTVRSCWPSWADCQHWWLGFCWKLLWSSALQKNNNNINESFRHHIMKWRKGVRISLRGKLNVRIKTRGLKNKDFKLLAANKEVQMFEFTLKVVPFPFPSAIISLWKSFSSHAFKEKLFHPKTNFSC